MRAVVTLTSAVLFLGGCGESGQTAAEGAGEAEQFVAEADAPVTADNARGQTEQQLQRIGTDSLKTIVHALVNRKLEVCEPSLSGPPDNRTIQSWTPRREALEGVDEYSSEEEVNLAVEKAISGAVGAAMPLLWDTAGTVRPSPPPGEPYFFVSLEQEPGRLVIPDGAFGFPVAAHQSVPNLGSDAHVEVFPKVGMPWAGGPQGPQPQPQRAGTAQIDITRELARQHDLLSEKKEIRARFTYRIDLAEPLSCNDPMLKLTYRLSAWDGEDLIGSNDFPSD